MITEQEPRAFKAGEWVMYRDKYLAQVIGPIETPTERELLTSIFGKQVRLRFDCTLPQVEDEIYSDPEFKNMVGIVDSVDDSDPSVAIVRKLEDKPRFEVGTQLHSKQLAERTSRFYADCPEFA